MAHPRGRQQQLNSLNKRGVSVAAVSGCSFSMSGYRDFRRCRGTTCGNHRANYPRHLGTLPAIVFAGQLHERIAQAGTRPFLISPYKREAGGSNPPAPTKFLQLDGLFKTLIGSRVTTAGNHRCTLPDRRRVPRGMAALSSSTGARPASTAGTTGVAGAAGAAPSARASDLTASAGGTRSAAGPIR